MNIGIIQLLTPASLLEATHLYLLDHEHSLAVRHEAQ